MIDLLLGGSALLFIYIIIDGVRSKTRRLFRRIVFYSFLFYTIKVMDLTIGNLFFPPLQEGDGGAQLVPLYFVWDLLRDYYHHGTNWFFWNSAKLSFYNFLMLMPLGVYIHFLFKVRNVKWAAALILCFSLAIETSQFFLSKFGFIIPRTFNVDDLFLNTVGGAIGFVIAERMGNALNQLHRLFETKKQNFE